MNSELHINLYMSLKSCFILLLLLLPFSVPAQSGTGTDSHAVVSSEQLLQNTQQSQDSLSIRSAAIDDSLSIRQQTDSLQQLVSSLDTLSLRMHLDSLQRLPQPTPLVQAKIDSVSNLLNVSSKASQQLSGLNQGLNQPLADSRQQLQQGVDKLTKPEGLNQEGMAELRQQSGIEMNTSLPEVKGVDMSGLNEPGMGIPERNIPAIDIQETALPGSDLSLPNLPKVKGPKEMQETLGLVNEISQEADQYTGNLAKVSEGRLNEIEGADKLAEEQLLRSEAGQALQQQSGVGEVQQMAGRDYLQEQGKKKVYDLAKDHFAEHKDKLNASREALAKYKGRFDKVESMKKMPEGFLKLNPLKDKPWQERVIIGSLWQFGKQEQYQIDLGPTLGWRFNDRIAAGGGFQYRLNINIEHKPWVNSADRVVGYFIFTDLQIKKGFFARLTFEDLQAAVPRYNATQQVEMTEQNWIKGLSIGVGKRYSFYKQLKGYSLIQYNLLHRHHRTPYIQPIQAKIGFYINGKYLQRKEKKVVKE